MPGARSGRIRFRTWLFLLALVAALPVMVFAVASVLEVTHGREREINAEIMQHALTAASAVDRSLDFQMAMLEAVTHSQAALELDIEGLYDHAKHLEPALPDALALTLIDRHGAQIFSTLKPFGTSLPPTGSPSAGQDIFRLNRPVVSGLSRGTITGEDVVALGVPLRVRRTPVYAVRMITHVKHYSDILADQQLPAGWTLTLVDSGGYILARTRDAATCVGRRVAGPLLAGRRADEPGILDAVNQEGVPVRVAAAPVGDWGWVVGVHVPVKTLRAPVRKNLLFLGAGMSVCVLAGMLGAWWLSRRLALEVDLVSSASAALACGDEPCIQPTLVQEFRQVGSSLREARQRGELAQLDHLTRLPGRAKFLAQAEHLAKQCRENPALRLAVLFLDLDGFKQVNDTYGHERGDEVLVQTAAILSAEVRQGDAVGRMGGDEFVICLAAEDSHALPTAEGVAGRIISRVDGIGHGIGCSVGVVLCPMGQPDLERALAASDEAMYQAKRAGRNRFFVRELARVEETAGL